MGNNLTNLLPSSLRPNRGGKRAYYVAILAVHNADEFNQYLAEFTSVADKFNGKALAETTDLSSPDAFADHAEGFHRCFVMEFPTAHDAEQWYRSEAYQRLKALRTKASSGPVTIAAANDDVIVDSARDAKHKALVVAFAKAPPVPHEEDGPMLGPSLKHYEGKLWLNCALTPQHFALPNKAIEFEEKEKDQDYDICYLLSFPTMDQAKAWRASDAYIHLDGPLVAVSI
ncbi:hypothetical protein MHU86_8972 [Fragilaria crotonensis]|nr:hypothetical protein MHU86_8972 [Fragilaria crotonensis]